MPGVLLRAESICKAFAGIEALRSVSFGLSAGESHALVGENGAGKSTLIKIITGAVEPDSGVLTICGEVIARNSPSVARSLGIAAIYQQPSLFPDLSVTENIALALETGGAWKPVDWRARREKAEALLKCIGANIKPDRVADSLSMPEQQLVEIAKAIGSGARILILDEPTASLSDHEVERLFRVIRALRGQGAGIVYISHRLEEIAVIADRITVLRDGEAAGTFAAGEIDRGSLIELMVGRKVASVFPKRAVPIGETALELHNVGCKETGIRDVSLTLKRGEILGLAGLVGSGRTRLAETIFGLTPAGSGEIRVLSEGVRIASPTIAIERGIAYVPEDRQRHGVVLEMPILANASLASLNRVSRLGLIQKDRERDLAERYIGQLRIKTPSPYVNAGALSGGNQQKVALARWLAIDPKVLILDEPTQGVDVAAKAEIHSLMMDLAEQGVAILMISSEIPEILGMSDRVAVMRAGMIAGVLSRQEATQQKILSLALGHPLQDETAIIH